MPAPHQFSRKLHEVIGDEAAEAMVDWMNRTDENFDGIRREAAEFRQTVRADFAELRQEMNTKLADIREEMRVGFAKLDAKFEARFAGVDSKFASMDSKFAALEAAAEKRHADFMKWTMGFWAVSLITYVGAIVALAQVIG
jgi:hypothetical protein